MPRKRLELNISSFEKRELENIIMQSRDDPQMLQRCKIILLTDQQIPLQEIADLLRLSKTTANTWRQVFKKNRINGLKDRKPVGRPPKEKDIKILQGRNRCKGTHHRPTPPAL
jgi:transposase